MGKTYKKCVSSIFRRPRGRCWAIINGVRKGAVPPDPWDGHVHCRLVGRPWKVAEKMVKAGFSRETSIRKLSRKFRIRYQRTEYIVDWTIRWYRRR